MPKYVLTFQYDGTNYVGWQVQPKDASVQKTCQEVLETVLRQKADLTGAGRTDSGVHALAQTAHIEVDTPLDLYRFKSSMNGLLPDDVRLLSVEEKPEDFHARYSAKGKIYRYHIALKGKESLFKRKYQWVLPYREFDVEKLKQGAKRLLGEHDFKGFASENHRGAASYDSIRTMKRLDIEEGEELILTFEADGFLYKMVRNLVGTLVDVGRGYFPPERIAEVLETGDRKLAGQAAPAHGLFLVKVLY
ncbi:MAG: tRNA pseudouridine(38-40) synthase TruA [Chlamydiia bacterium]|nr:tRNA pseudouridine(38-40) synthase TruA [Chlamydiia bacterium]